MKVSIIVPAYNVAQYLHECVDSILAQTYRDIEVILVDDGSTKDNTPQICDEYAAKDPRVKVVHKKNGGLPKARETGINASSGELIYCVDADDSIEPDTIESLVPLMTEDVDLVAAEEDFDKVMTPEEYGNWFLHWNAIHVWGKLYRRSVIADPWVFDFDRSITVAEDFVTNLRCMKNLKRNVAVSSLRKYHYRQLPESMVHKFTSTSEYDLKIMQEATKIVADVPLDLREGFAAYRIGVIGHLIYRNDPVDKKLATEIGNSAKDVRVSCSDRLILKAMDSRLYATLFKIFNLFDKAVKRIKRKLKWR